MEESAFKQFIGGATSLYYCCTCWEKELEFSALFTPLGYRSVGLESALLTYGNKRSLHRTNWCQLWL